ncbi:MAG: SAM-dependent methyltransferase, partial [Cyanobacteria bacterium]|nr:SAM-dependent methyltransferase [Cyanobacteriota bacterium]
MLQPSTVLSKSKSSSQKGSQSLHKIFIGLCQELMTEIGEAAASGAKSHKHQTEIHLSSEVLSQISFYTVSKLFLLTLWQENQLIPETSPQQTWEAFSDLCAQIEASQAIELEGGIAFPHQPSFFNRHTPSDTFQKKALKLLKPFMSSHVLNDPENPQDFLGDFYEKMTPSLSKKKQGQFFTPMSLAQYLVDRSLPELFKDIHTPWRAYEPAMGSGRFLLALAGKLYQYFQSHPQEPKALQQRNHLPLLMGADIDLFAAHLSLLNFLIWMTPFLQAQHPLPFTLHLACKNSLSLIEESPSFGAPVNYCFGNPPFIGEKGQKELFQKTLLQYPSWRSYYQGKMDYFYFFIHLGIEKLQEGGRLAFVTTRYWLTADGAKGLREAILAHCKIIELIEFEKTNVFNLAGGQHTLLVILEKTQDKTSRESHHPQWSLIKGSKGNPIKTLSSLSAGSPWIETVKHTTSQGGVPLKHALRSEIPLFSWHPSSSSDLESLLQRVKTKGIPLSELLQDQQGVISGADRVTQAHLNRLDPRWATTHQIHLGEGIFCLSPQERQTFQKANGPLTLTELECIKPFYKNSHVYPYGLSQQDETTSSALLYLTDETPLESVPNLIHHLERFKPILETKRECQQGKIPWYSLHWPRNPDILNAQSLVTARRGKWNAFAMAPVGWFENSDLTVLTLKAISPSETKQTLHGLLYYMGLLNSSLLDVWMAHRGKSKGHLREYYATPLRKLPLLPLETMKEAPTLCRWVQEMIHIQVDLLRTAPAEVHPLLKSTRPEGYLKQYLVSET